MEYTNQWITNRTKTKTDIDSSFGLFLSSTGTMIGDISLGADASLIISGYNDTSTFNLTIDSAGTLKAYNIST